MGILLQRRFSMKRNIKWQFFEPNAVPMTVSSPEGPISIEQWSIHDDLEQWIGNCDFTVTNAVVDKLDTIEGIDTLQVISRHRFIIGIGKMFTFHDVRLKIDSVLCNKNANDTELDKIDNTKVKDEINKLQSNLKSYKYWAIYVFPNGKIDYCASNELDDSFLEKYDVFNKAKNLSSGILIQNAEESYD